MTRLLAAAGALALLAAAGPALASDDAVFAACAAPAGATVVVPDADADTQDVTAPVGALGLLAEEVVGDVYVDLAGRSVDSDAALQLVLAWDNPVADYDLYVDGASDLSTDSPEVKSLVVEHCQKVSVAVQTYLGAPVDALTLATSAVEVPVEEQ